MMSKQNLIRVFIKFLKYNQAYDSYLSLLKETRGSKKSQEFIIKCVKKEPDNLIIHAFPWRSTSKQKKTWSELHREWTRFVEKKCF